MLEHYTLKSNIQKVLLFNILWVRNNSEGYKTSLVCGQKVSKKSNFRFICRRGGGGGGVFSNWTASERLLASWVSREKERQYKFAREAEWWKQNGKKISFQFLKIGNMIANAVNLVRIGGYFTRWQVLVWPKKQNWNAWKLGKKKSAKNLIKIYLSLDFKTLWKPFIVIVFVFNL